MSACLLLLCVFPANIKPLFEHTILTDFTIHTKFKKKEDNILSMEIYILKILNYLGLLVNSANIIN